MPICKSVTMPTVAVNAVHIYTVIMCGLRRIPSLQSYGGKVFWISASDVISVVDVSGCSVAEMRASTDASSLLTAFAVNYSTKYKYPGERFSRAVIYNCFTITNYKVCHHKSSIRFYKADIVLSKPR